MLDERVEVALFIDNFSKNFFIATYSSL